MKNRVLLAAGLFVALAWAGGAVAAAQTAEQTPASLFEDRAREYSLLRERLEDELPKLPKEATPEQIEAHKKAFRERVRAERADAKAGQLFTPEVAAHIRTIVRQTFDGKDRAELRQTILEAENKGIAVRVNHTYPEAKELVEMPPPLLLALPQLPKQLRYRFVGQYLLLVDRENGLIVDYMSNALP